jgi:hypothetical protein
MWRTIILATLIAGTLDILSAFLWTGMEGGTPGQVLQSVASGPFGDSMREDSRGIPLGLLVHFAIMLAMAAAYVLIAPRFPILMRQWLVAGVLYGLLLWLIMYWIVLPLRWGMSPPSEAPAIARQLISHCLLTGIPIAWITARAQASARR